MHEKNVGQANIFMASIFFNVGGVKKYVGCAKKNVGCMTKKVGGQIKNVNRKD